MPWRWTALLPQGIRRCDDCCYYYVSIVLPQSRSHPSGGHTRQYFSILLVLVEGTWSPLLQAGVLVRGKSLSLLIRGVVT